MNPAQQILWFGDQQINGQELRERAARAASGFLSLGLERGDTVAVVLRNEPVYLEVMLALGQLGVHLVAVNWHFQPAEAGFVLRDCGARVLVAHTDLLPPLRPVVPPGMVVIAVPTPDLVRDAYGIGDRSEPPSDSLVWPEWRDGFAPNTRPAVPSPGSMLYTSGTTGSPKAVMRLPGTPRQHEGSLRVRAWASQAREGMRTAMVGPLYHAGPNSAARVALEKAELIHVMPRFDARELLDGIQTHRLTHLSLVPIMLVRLLKLPPEVRSGYDVSSLENVTHGGSPCAPDVKRALIGWWGSIISETYGSTEAGLVTHASAQEWLQRPGTVGRPFPGTSIRILDEQGAPLPPGSIGEIFMNPGDNALPFTYRNNAAQRSAIERDGHFSNGDIGYLDADGYLFVTDRKRDMVISGGVNIYPAEVEHALMGCPEVADCAVFGIPDAEFGEALAAAVVPMPGHTPTAQSLRGWLRTRLAGYKVPTVFEMRESLPRESMGKVFKNELRAPYWQHVGRRI
jgi:long-chain acyl-CoA synthetase